MDPVYGRKARFAHPLGGPRPRRARSRPPASGHITGTRVRLVTLSETNGKSLLASATVPVAVMVL